MGSNLDRELLRYVYLQFVWLAVQHLARIALSRVNVHRIPKKWHICGCLRLVTAATDAVPHARKWKA
jgi:hypothetical protein